MNDISENLSGRLELVSALEAKPIPFRRNVNTTIAHYLCGFLFSDWHKTKSMWS